MPLGSTGEQFEEADGRRGEGVLRLRPGRLEDVSQRVAIHALEVADELVPRGCDKHVLAAELGEHRKQLFHPAFVRFVITAGGKHYCETLIRVGITEPNICFTLLSELPFIPFCSAVNLEEEHVIRISP